MDPRSDSCEPDDHRRDPTGVRRVRHRRAADPEDGLDPPERETDWEQYRREWASTAPARHERALIDLLHAESGDQSWWLGYLDTGASDIVFPDAPIVLPYSCGWRYVLINAGPSEAISWRDHEHAWTTAIPDMVFPADRSWLLTTLWNDTWTCIGGRHQLINGLLNQPLLRHRTRHVTTDQDATPPGHTAI